MQSKGWAPTLMWRLLHPGRVGDFVKPRHTQGLLGHSQSQTGWLAQHACAASTSLIPWGSPGWTPQPCCRVWGALGCHQAGPHSPCANRSQSLEAPLTEVIWKRADVGAAGVGGISLGKCFPLSITSPGCCLLRNTRNWQAVGGMPGFQSCCGPRAPGRAGRSVAPSGTGGFPAPGTGTFGSI